MKTKRSFCTLPLCSFLLLGPAATSALLLAPAPVHAEPTREITVGTRWPQLIATNGKVYRNVKFTFVSPREVRFMHTDGIGSLPLSQVVAPDDVALPVLLGQEHLPPELTMGPLGHMMTPQERKVSGIDKLSNDEQSTLAEWVRNTVEDRLKEELERRGLPPTWSEVAPPSSSSAVLAQATPAAVSQPTRATAATPTPLLPPPGSPAVSAGRPGTEPAPAAATGIVESSIDGEFRGLEAQRVFRLNNGQLWRQQDAVASSHTAYEPRVTLYPNARDGAWMMKVDGVDRPVRVEPVPVAVAGRR